MGTRPEVCGHGGKRRKRGAPINRLTPMNMTYRSRTCPFRTFLTHPGPGSSLYYSYITSQGSRTLQIYISGQRETVGKLDEQSV